MNKTILLSVGAIIAIISSVIVIRLNNTPSSPTGAAPATDSPAAISEQMIPATVVYTDSGFSPTIITVKAGETVVFKNESARSMWVASDPHPSHTGFRAFDAKRNHKTGETYQFTFNEPGTYAYHNHSDAGDRGSVVVQ